MQLIKTRKQPPIAGLPASYREWWDIGNKYEISIFLHENVCSLGVSRSGRSITFEVAKHLGLDTDIKDIKFGEKSNGRELYLSLGIDCIVLNYTKPENYKELLKKIEEIVNEHFKQK